MVASVDVALQLAAAGVGVAVIDGFHRVPPSLRTAPILDAPPVSLHVLHTRTVHMERGPDAMMRAIFDTLG